MFVFPDKQGKAIGEVYMDDGSSVDPVENSLYSLLSLTYSNLTLTASPGPTHHQSPARLGSVWFAGLQGAVAGVSCRTWDTTR